MQKNCKMQHLRPHNARKRGKLAVLKDSQRKLHIFRALVWNNGQLCPPEQYLKTYMFVLSLRKRILTLAFIGQRGRDAIKFLQYTEQSSTIQQRITNSNNVKYAKLRSLLEREKFYNGGFPLKSMEARQKCCNIC